MSTDIAISHKILLIPNNQAITYFRKAFGCARKAYNWGLAKWKEDYNNGIKTDKYKLKKEFNALKKTEFPYVYEVTKYATQQPFIHLGLAFEKFFRDLKKGKVSYPKFKSRKDNQGSFYIGADHIKIIEKNGKSYLKIPYLPPVKMTENIRFNGKINNVVISQKGNSFYASFSMKISQEEYQNTHNIKMVTNQSLGIDVGIKSFVSLSNGLSINAPKPLAKLTRKLKRIQRQLSKKQHPKTKDDNTKKSKNYLKQSKKLSQLHLRITNIRQDFLHKLTSVLVNSCDNFYLEDLSVQNMMKNHTLAKALADVSIFEFNRQLEYKTSYAYKNIHRADRFYPSSKTCSYCGHIKKELTLKDRTYYCNKCGFIIDRDYNAAINLIKIGGVTAEYTPADLTAMLDRLAINNLVTSKVETGKQQKVNL